MKKLLGLILTAVLLTVLLAGCGTFNVGAPAGPSTYTPTDLPSSTPEPTAEPTAEPTSTPEPSPMSDVACNGVSLSYDPALASGVSCDTDPGISPDEGMGPNMSLPAYTLISFEGYAVSDSFHEPRILVIPLVDLLDMNPMAAGFAGTLHELIGEQDTAPDSIPFLPPFNAAQIFTAQVAYLNFQGGQGVRFLTEYAQYFAPVNNYDLFYTFQGITDDGAYWVSVILPITHSSLQADASTVPGGDLDAFSADYQQYIDDQVAALNGQSPESFAPMLPMLDALVESISIP